MIIVIGRLTIACNNDSMLFAPNVNINLIYHYVYMITYIFEQFKFIFFGGRVGSVEVWEDCWCLSGSRIMSSFGVRQNQD